MVVYVVSIDRGFVIYRKKMSLSPTGEKLYRSGPQPYIKCRLLAYPGGYYAFNLEVSFDPKSGSFFVMPLPETPEICYETYASRQYSKASAGIKMMEEELKEKPTFSPMQIEVEQTPGRKFGQDLTFYPALEQDKYFLSSRSKETIVSPGKRLKTSRRLFADKMERRAESVLGHHGAFFSLEVQEKKMEAAPVIVSIPMDIKTFTKKVSSNIDYFTKPIIGTLFPAQATSNLICDDWPLELKNEFNDAPKRKQYEAYIAWQISEIVFGKILELYNEAQVSSSLSISEKRDRS